jgi:hypothetical protein
MLRQSTDSERDQEVDEEAARIGNHQLAAPCCHALAAARLSEAAETVADHRGRSSNARADLASENCSSLGGKRTLCDISRENGRTILVTKQLVDVRGAGVAAPLLSHVDANPRKSLRGIRRRHQTEEVSSDSSHSSANGLSTELVPSRMSRGEAKLSPSQEHPAHLHSLRNCFGYFFHGVLLKPASLASPRKRIQSEIREKSA